jgi:hypothetical protein
MNTLKSVVTALGAVLAAALIYAILAAPGFLSDRDSTVPLITHQQAAR